MGEYGISIYGVLYALGTEQDSIRFTSGQPQKNKGDIIKTNGQDTVLRVPKRNIDDRMFIKSIGSAVMKLQFDAEKMSIKDRDNHIITKLSKMEEKGAF